MIERIRKLRLEMKGKDIPASLIMKQENYFYLSGFSGTSAILLITDTDALLITDFRYIEQARNEAKDFNVVNNENSISESISKELLARNISVIGFEEDYLTVKQLEQYKLRTNNVEWKPLKGIVENVRVVKDQKELAIIKEAVEIADEAFSHVLKFIKPGVREVELAAEIEYYMRKRGAKGTSFETIVASGVRGALPHGVASNKSVELGEAITLDFGAVWKGYCSDMTRTVFLGKPETRMKEIYEIVKKAQETALLAVSAGMETKQLDQIARSIIQDAGYGDCFGHGLGHGVGIEVHEEPRLSPRGSDILKDGMVITIEPGIYVSGLGGVRIEDMVVVDKGKPIVLTKSSKEMIIL